MTGVQLSTTADVLSGVALACDTVAAAPDVVHQLSDRELTSLTRDVLAVMQLAEAALVELTSAAISRGTVSDSTAAGPGQWLARLSAGEELSAMLLKSAPTVAGPLVRYDDTSVADSGGSDAEASDASPAVEDVARHQVPGIPAAHAGRIAKVATACTQLRNEVVRTAVAEGRASAQTALTAVDEVDRVLHAMPNATRDEIFGYFLDLPPGAGPARVKQLSRMLVLRFGDPSQVEFDEERLDAAERLRWHPLPNGLTRLEADLAPTNAARLKQAIDALSAPSPGNKCCDDVFHRHVGDPTGVADERPPEKRRLDALVLLVTRAAGLIDADPTVESSGAATIVVTIDFDSLAGQLTRAGRTSTGEPLTVANVRRLACDADIIPMVLGSRAQPLDVGRRQRLVKGELRSAVVQRDRCCTFPGCDRPPNWCQVHHVMPWQHGGATSLANSALLCQAHHTTVHRLGLMAEVSDDGVEWDLHPGRMPSSG